MERSRAQRRFLSRVKAQKRLRISRSHGGGELPGGYLSKDFHHDHAIVHGSSSFARHARLAHILQAEVTAEISQAV